MAANPTWKGFVKLSLVAFPVKAFTAAESVGGEIHLNQLHDECHSRIQYRKHCPIHGEVQQQDIVSGYEYSKGQYVVVDPADVDLLRTPDDKAIAISAFIDPDALDPIYLSGKTYYLVPDGPVAQKPYAVILEAMKEDKRYGIAQVVLHGREHVVLLRPLGNLLAMSVLNYESRVTKPSAFEAEVPKAEPSAEEVNLTRELIKASTARKFDLAKYQDEYTDKLRKLIEAKVAGQEIVAQPVQEHAQVINLMDALKASLATAQGREMSGEPAEPPTEQPAAEVKPPKLMAPSKGKESRGRKKKSS
jgi:DNA end-binding protein Ku